MYSSYNFNILNNFKNDPMEIEILCVSCNEYHTESDIKKCANPVCLACYKKLKYGIWGKFFNTSTQERCPCCNLSLINRFNFEVKKIAHTSRWIPMCIVCYSKPS